MRAVGSDAAGVAKRSSGAPPSRRLLPVVAITRRSKLRAVSRYELRPEEVDALRVVLQAITVSQPSGEIGVVHGADRFVSSRFGLSVSGVDGLDRLAKKLDVPGGLRITQQ